MARIVFMGTPGFAVPSLTALTASHVVAGVVTQPDRPAGRGRRPAESAVKQFAREAGLPVIQPEKLREPGALAQLRAWEPELIVVAAFGQILRPSVLDLPPHGCLNVHASLLPRWRGAAPISAAILAGDEQTGVTIMKMDAGLDTGPILTQRAEAIRRDDTTDSLSGRLARLGAELLLHTLPDYLGGRSAWRAQDEALATYAPQLKKEAGRLDFDHPAAEIERRVRAFTPWPGAFAEWHGQPLKVLRAERLAEARGAAGEVIDTPRGPAVVCGQGGGILLLEVQPAGKKPMPAADFARGARGFVGARLAQR